MTELSSGFTTATRFDSSLVDFFAQANLGPRVTGTFDVKTTQFTDKTGEIITLERRVPNQESLNSTQESLNSGLIFTQTESPLYCCARIGNLCTLFALHAFYEKMKHLDDKKRLSASRQMREHLATLMERVIENDAQRMKEKYSNDEFVTTQIDQAVPRLIANIRDPKDTDPKAGLILDESEATIGELFNPNWFLYAHFSKLIGIAKQAMVDISPEEQALLDTQQDEISLARAYKVKV